MAEAVSQQHQQQQVEEGIGSIMNPDAFLLNSYRIAAVADRLAMYVQGNQQSEAKEIFNLCIYLARGIDYAVANNEVPSTAHELPSVLKQVCRRKEDLSLQAAIMVLMISVKTACRSGWFLAKDAEDLLTLANEFWSSYCSTEYIQAQPSNDLPIISKIFARFYPGMKLGDFLGYLEIKPCWGAFVYDFNISRNTKCGPEDIFLFVAQIDNTETSSCIISPPLVNFLLNGKGVQKHINVSMENGPQFPTNVTSMLKCGTNILQAVGQFNGNYIMAVLFLSVTTFLDTPVLQDHDGPRVVAHDSDSEILEGPSRISLNCPISMSRIRTPVKGHGCKHHQCFDYDNFIKMNLRRPSWRCPHCNQSVTYTDIRIDQFMVKVLQEVGETVGAVVISADGSWKSDKQSGECTDSFRDQQDLSKENEDSQANVVDLTLEGMESSDAMSTWETEDRKPFKDIVKGCPIVSNTDVPPLEMNNASQIVQDAAPLLVDSFWSRVLQSCSSSEATSQSSPMNSMSASLPSDPISLFLGQESGGAYGTTQPTRVHPSQLVVPSNSQFGDSIVNNDVRRPPIPRNVCRTPIAIQALAVPSFPNPPQRPRTNSYYRISNHDPLTSQTLPSIAANSDASSVGQINMERHQFSWSAANSFPDVPATQNWKRQPNLHAQMQPQQQIIGVVATSQASGAYIGSSGIPPVYQNQPHQQVRNLGVPQSMTRPTNLVQAANQSLAQPANQFSLSQVQRGLQTAGYQTPGSVTNTNTSSRIATSAQRATNMARALSVEPVQLQAPTAGSSVSLTGHGLRSLIREQRGNMGGTVQQVSSTHDLIELPSEHNWRPQGRMRGSLTGRPISPSVGQLIIQPTEMTQLSRPPPNLTSQPAVFLPTHRLQVNNSMRNANGSQS